MMLHFYRHSHACMHACKHAESVSRYLFPSQELQNAHRDSSGQIPRTIEVELTEDLVDSCTAGDVVTIAGIVKVINTEALAGMLRMPSSIIDSSSCLHAVQCD